MIARHSHRPRVGLVLAVALATGACAAGDGAADRSGAGTGTAASAPEQLPPSGFAPVVADEDVVTINVHVPDDGSLPGTDAAIPYDRLTDRVAELPADRSTPLAVYCLTGRMSAVAVQNLRELGYTDITELGGGMEAWRADGRELLPPAG